MTKKVKKRKQESKAIKDNSKEKSASIEKNEAGNTFDFGGLPPRDLKKNLGCG